VTSGFVTKVELFRAQFEVFLVVWVFGLSSAQVFFFVSSESYAHKAAFALQWLAKGFSSGVQFIEDFSSH